MARDGMWVQATVDRLLQDHLTGRSDHGNRLWLLLNSEVWYRMFIEGISVDKFADEIAAAAVGMSPV